MSITSTTMIWRAKIAAAWEIRYCQEEGSIPWEKIATTQSSMESRESDDEFKRCWDWDASSGEEALRKAKAQYWCKLNGFSFGSQTITNNESADMYNDTNIDWSPKIDPEVSLALNRWDDDDAIVNDDDDYLPIQDETFTIGWGTDYTKYEDE
ncbi:uncharacterized protein LOC113291873 [Papaver somniferum]|uniref:uncharacterized protein LOC113291873 n=1 Tax=Papaver somniferum TaxID=3469 RepID=UPI000E705164|nr:uncharacterized protein LOC113291873 [Papaver somniferum]